MLEILIVGAVSSAIYAMLAVGFTLIFGVARILNLAHGSFYALGAYGAYFFTYATEAAAVAGRAAGDRGGGACSASWSSG